MLWKLIHNMFKNRRNCEAFKICKKWLFLITLSGFDKNVTKFWEDEIT